MVRKTIRIGLHEIKTVDIACPYCRTRIRYDLDKYVKAIECPACKKEYPDYVYEGLVLLRDAFGRLHQDKKGITEFEIELKDD
jgi:uncharacterized protein YbaR (Trm112 family)